MTDVQRNYELLRELASESGADLFGVADITGERHKFDEEIRHQAASLPYAVVMATRLSAAIFDTIEDRPTNIYKTHYRAANRLLDDIAYKVSRKIIGMGHKTIPVAASFITDWEKQTAHVSHKRLAELAGLGWWGRNNLVVNPRYGPAIRLVSVLTDFPLAADKPLEFGCGDCMDCIEFCPAGAIRENPADFDHIACFEKLREFMKYKSFGQYICGICIKHCPLTYG